MIVNFYDLRILAAFVILTIILIYISAKKKKSIFSLLVLLTYISTLTTHVVCYCKFDLNIIIDFVGIIVSIVSFIIVDDIEARRQKLSEVFNKKYT